MPTGLLNVVCDECHGGELYILPTGERQLEHQPGCPYKWREDTFLVQLCQGLDSMDDSHFTYPKEGKLNPIIYDYMCHGQMTEERANKVNKNFQLVREALIKDGTWKYYLEDMRLQREMMLQT